MNAIIHKNEENTQKIYKPYSQIKILWYTIAYRIFHAAAGRKYGEITACETAETTNAEWDTGFAVRCETG